MLLPAGNMSRSGIRIAHFIVGQFKVLVERFNLSSGLSFEALLRYLSTGAAWIIIASQLVIERCSSLACLVVV